MIEIASCMNDLTQGAVWRGKHAHTRLAKISSVWFQKATDTWCVGFHIWDSQGTKEERDGWKTSKVLSEADFREIFVYAEHHVLNNAREAEKTKYLTSRVLAEISNRFDSELRAEGMELAKQLVTLAKRAAGYEIALHDWDEGCVGSGCCADTADMGGDLLIDQNFLTAEEIQALLAE
jgi:hypothetical protein